MHRFLFETVSAWYTKKLILKDRQATALFVLISRFYLLLGSYCQKRQKRTIYFCIFFLRKTVFSFSWVCLLSQRGLTNVALDGVSHVLEEVKIRRDTCSLFAHCLYISVLFTYSAQGGESRTKRATDWVRAASFSHKRNKSSVRNRVSNFCECSYLVAAVAQGAPVANHQLLCLVFA